MLHEPAGPAGNDRAIGYKMRAGVWMFLLYAIVYGGFVIINVVSPLSMERIVFMGLNLAIVYGMVLIVFAFILAIIYSRLCSVRERNNSDNDSNQGE